MAYMAAPSTCPKCNQPLADQAKFCGKCGAPTSDASMKTLVEFAAPVSRPLDRTQIDATRPDVPAFAPPAPAAPTPVVNRAAIAKTMIGVAAADLQPSPAPQPQAPPGQRAAVGKTMLGVAIPGIAPTSPGQPPARSGTMLGIAIPGIAPLRAGGPQQATPTPARQAHPAPPIEPIVPMPAPFIDDEAVPAAPPRPRRSGVPLSAVAGILAGIVLIAGIAVALLWKGAPPIFARPTLDAQGRETLQMSCESCADGTQIVFGGNKTEFRAHEATLLLATPLQVGENALALQIYRPGMGRDETLKIVVPVTFRIRADMSNVSAKRPLIIVRVEAVAGSEVEVDGRSVTLDAEGRGSHSVDISAETEGQSPSAKRVEKKIPYSVAHKGSPRSSGTLPVGVAVVPLQLDAPGSHAVTDQRSILVAGQSTVGAKITINGEAVTSDVTGAFAKSIAAPAPGNVEVEVSAAAPQQATRSVHLTVRRVESLEAEAKAAEATPPLSYDAVKDDITSHVAQRVLVEGEIIDTRVAGRQTIIVLSDTRGCAKKADPNECLARVLFGGEDTRKKGERVRVFGRITRAVAAQNGRNVPEIEADFLAKARGG